MSSQGTKRKAPAPPFGRLAVTDELGLVKVVEVPNGPSWDATSIVHVWGQPDKSRCIHTVAAPDFSKDSFEDVVAVARQGGTVEVLETSEGACVATLTAFKAPSSVSNPREMSEVKCLIFRQKQDNPLGLISSTVSGHVRLAAIQVEPSANLEVSCSFQSASNVGCMALSPNQDHIAVGGEGCQLQVWDLNTQQQVFKAKGGKPNKVGNVDLPHLTALTYLPDPSNQVIVAGTVKHKLWLYDQRAGKRPQKELSWGEKRITCLEPEHDGGRVWVANGTGHIEALEVGAWRMKGAMKGAAGSIRSLALHPNTDLEEPLLAAAGLDRFGRIYSADTRASKCKVYCKQQLTGIAWLRPPQPAAQEEVDDDQQGEAGRQDAGGDDQQAGVEKVQKAAAQKSKSKDGKQQSSSKKKSKKQ